MSNDGGKQTESTETLTRQKNRSAVFRTLPIEQDSREVSNTDAGTHIIVPLESEASLAEQSKEQTISNKNIPSNHNVSKNFNKQRKKQSKSNKNSQPNHNETQKFSKEMKKPDLDLISALKSKSNTLQIQLPESDIPPVNIADKSSAISQKTQSMNKLSNPPENINNLIDKDQNINIHLVHVTQNQKQLVQKVLSNPLETESVEDRLNLKNHEISDDNSLENVDEQILSNIKISESREKHPLQVYKKKSKSNNVIEPSSDVTFEAAQEITCAHSDNNHLAVAITKVNEENTSANSNKNLLVVSGPSQNLMVRRASKSGLQTVFIVGSKVKKAPPEVGCPLGRCRHPPEPPSNSDEYPVKKSKKNEKKKKRKCMIM